MSTTGIHRRSIAAFGLSALLAFVSAAPATAQPFLVDTGAGANTSIGSPTAFASGSATCQPQPACAAHFQFIGAQFTLPAAAAVSSISAWIGPFGTGGSMDVKIRENVNGLPSLNAPPLFSPNSIYTKRYTGLPNFGGTAGWVSFPQYEAVLAAGTYWLTFEPVHASGLNYSMPGQTANPLPKYAYYTDGNPGYLALNSATNANNRLGIRIGGTFFPGVAFGTATRVIATGANFSCCPYDYDLVQEGTRDFVRVGTEGPALTVSYIFVIGTSSVHARGKIFANGLSAGAYSATTSAVGAGRGVAYRTFINMSNVAKTFRINADLHGAFHDAGGTARGAIYAFDTTAFSETLIASQKTAGHFLLDADDRFDLANENHDISLARFFPAEALLTSDHETASFPEGVPSTVPLQTGFITLDPGETVTVMFDVAIASANGGGVNFYDTLTPAAAFITDAQGQPVIEIVAVGPLSPPSPAPASIVLTPADESKPAGTAHNAVATVTGTGAVPVVESVVTFTITSGPNAGMTADVPTDVNGEATFTYTSAALGTDEIHASGSGLESNAATTTWTCGAKGDANGDLNVTVLDVFYLINSLFAGGAAPKGCANVNGDANLDVLDVFYLINYLFAGGSPPV